jgi:hypothetical protein
MQRRAFERIPANISARFYCDKSDYSGRVTNLSAKGMYISTDQICFPLDAEFELILNIEAAILSVPVKIRRITRTADRYDGIGVELLNLPQKYLEFIGSLRNNQ